MKRNEGKHHQGFIVQPNQKDYANPTQMSIGGSGKLKSMMNNKNRESNISKKSSQNSAYPITSSIGFGLPRLDKPVIHKEKKESSKNLREGIKCIERTSIERNKIK